MDFGKYNKEKVFRYSIRKYHFGAASVAVAALMFFANGAVAAHEPITPATANEVATVGSDGKADGDLGSSDEGDSNKVLTDQPAELKAADEVKTQEAPAEGTNQGQAGAESNSAQSETNPANQEPSQAGEVKEQEQPTVADTTAAKSTQGNLQALLAKLTLSSMQKLHAEVEARLAAAKAVLEDPKATQAQVDEQARLMAELMSRVNQALTPALENPTILEKAGLASTDLTSTGLATPDGAVTEQPTGGKRRRRGGLSASEPAANQDTPSAGRNTTTSGAGSQATSQTLPTYTNTEGKNGVYDLKDELEFITEQLRANGASADKIQAAKAAVDKFNEAFSKGDTISQEDFSAALADLKKSRDLIEGVLAEKEANGGEVTGPVNPAESATPSANNVTIQPRTNATGWSGFRNVPAGAARTRAPRAAGQNRDGSNSFANSLEYYLEDGRKGNSPYERFTYVYYTERNSRGRDENNKPVSGAEEYLYADLTKINGGWKWDIYLNNGHHELDSERVWFTLPKTHTIVENSVNINRKNQNGTSTSKGFNNLRDGLTDSFVGFKNLSVGTPKRSDIRREPNDWERTQNFATSSLNDLARQDAASLRPRLLNNNAADKKLVDDKFTKINESNSDLYSFLTNGTRDAYRISFITKSNDRPEDLVTAFGVRGVRQSNGTFTHYLVNQWHARAASEIGDVDRFKFRVSGNGYFKVNQHTAYVNFAPDYAIKTGTKVKQEGNNIASNYPNQIDKPLDAETKGVLTFASDNTANTAFEIDMTSYGDYYDANGKLYEKQTGKGLANNKGQKFQLMSNKGTPMTKKEVTIDAISTPGVHTYRYNRWFEKEANGDGSHDTGKFSIVTKPKTPTIKTDLTRVAGVASNIEVSGGTKGYDVILYKKEGDTLVSVKGSDQQPIKATANANGVATFSGLKLEIGTYVAKTVVEGDWTDYDGTEKHDVSSDPSAEKAATDGLPPKVRIVNGSELPEARNDADPALYEVVQGQPFRPRIEAFDNIGNLTKFQITNLPPGVTATNANTAFRANNNATASNTFEATFSGNVPNDRTPGTYTSTITVSDGSTGDKQYFFKYRVIARDNEAPTVTMNGKALTENAADNRFVIYRGATFNPTFTVSDNSGTVSSFKMSGGPAGVWFNKNGSNDDAKTNLTSGTSYQLTANNVVDTNAALGTSEASVVVSDANNNAKTYKFQYTVVDIQPKNSPKDVAVNSTLGKPQDYLKVVDSTTSAGESKYLPDGVTYKWLDSTTFRDAPNSTVLSEVGSVTKYYATVAFPQSNTVVKKRIDNVEHTIYYPANAPRPVVFNVQDTVAPTVKLTNKANNNTEVTLTTDPSVTTIDVYRGATIELPLKYYDNANTGKVNIGYKEGLPKGVLFNSNESATTSTTINESSKTETTPGTYTVRGRVATDATLGVHTVTLKVSDDANGNVDQGNKKEVKFNIRVLDIDFESGYSQATGTTKITKEVGLNQQTPDPNEYLTATTGTGVGTGINRNDNLFPRDMTFRYITGENDNEFRTTLTFTAPGKYLVKAGAFYPTTYVPTNGLSTTPANATGDRIDEIRNRTYTTREIEFDVKPTAPTVTAEANGDVVVSHTNQTNVNTLSFTYTDKDNNQQTVTATKTGNTWALTNAPADGVTIEATSGAVTIKDRQVKDTTAVTAKVVAQDVESTVSTGTSLAGEKTAPTFTFSDKYTALVNGERVVYVTPTEDLANGSITLGTVNDNSGKLREVVLYHGDGRRTNMEFGLDYNKKEKANNVEFNAPYNIEITGKLPKLNPNTNQIWANNFDVVTRYVGATDAADNELKNISDNNQNLTRVKIKVLTQAAKYEPTINAQTLKKDLTVSGVSVTEAEFNKMKPNLTFSTNKGDVKVAYNSPDMNIAMKDGGAIKSEGGSYYVGATITYPDGSTKDIRIPVENADKVAPTVKLTNKTDENRVVTLNDKESTSPVVTVYRGANLNLPLTFFDNDSDGRVNLKYVSGLPSGIQFNGTSDTLTVTGKTQDSVGTHTITGRIPANAQLGLTTVTLKVSDGSNGVDSGNKAEVKFRLKVVDLDFEPSRSAQANQSSITVPATAGQRLEDANNYLTVNDGTNRQDAGNFPSGMTFRMVNEAGQVITNLPDAPGRHVVKARAYFPAGYAGTDGIGTVVTGNTDSELNGRRYIEKTINFEVKPQAPVVSPQDNGDVLITQANETNVNRLKVTYTTQTNPQEVTYTASKNGDTWSFGSGTPITIDGVTGAVKIKDRLVQDGSTVKVTAFMTTNGNLESSEATGVAKDGDPVFPTVEFQNVETDAAGNRVVYITPTEDTNLPVATFKDNSNKLSQAGFVEYNGNLANLGGVGIDYERYPASGDTTYPAPKTLTVTGTLNKYRTGSTLWNNDETIVTRYASVIDAAGNDLHTVDGNKVNANTSPTRVLFKVRTQATKYTPTITPQRLERDIALSNAAVTQTEFDAMKQNLTFTTTKGDVKVAYNTQDMSINLKDNGAITRNPTDNTYSIGASITYPDGSTEDIQIPVTAPTQKEIYEPTAVEKTVDKGSQPTAEDSIANATSLPTNTRFTWKAGTLDTSTPGVKQATITVAYPDGSSEDVERVTVNVKPSQPAVTPADNGDVTVTPVTEATVDKLEVTYTPADNNQLQVSGEVRKTAQAATTIVATKGADNQWSITSGQKDGISIDATTGAITLKDVAVKDQANVTAKVAAQGIESAETTKQAGTGDQTSPVIGASSKIVETEKTVDIPLELSDAGVGIDEGNIIVSGLPSGLIYDDDTQSIKGTLRSVSQNDIKVTVLDKNGNKADKTITITAVKPKAVYAIKDATVANVANAANFVEVPEGVTLTSATWKNGEQPTTETVGTTTKTVEVSLNGVNTELTIPVTVYPGVTLRKVNNQEVTTYHEVVSQPLTSAVWGTQGRTQAPTADFYVAFEGNRPAGTTVEFKDGLPLSTVAGETRHTIVVTYPNGAGTVEKTVTFRTYGYETNYPAGKEYFETEVGKPFANAGAGSYVKPSSNLSTPSRIWIGWGNHGLGASPVQSAQRTIGVREENVNVYYGTTVQNQRGDTSNLYSEQDIKVALAVKPKAPTLQGQAGTRPAVTVSNLPEASQLASGATVKVQLKDAQGDVVAEKEITAGTTTIAFAAADYKKDLTLGEQLTTNVLVSGTYKKTIAKNTTEDTAYEVSSAKSDSVTVKTYADFYRDQVTYPTNAEKVTYGNTAITDGNFTDAAKESFAAKIKEANANNNNLPADVTYTKGTTDDKAKVATINFPEDGSTIDISHTQVAKPEVPTFTKTAGTVEDPKLSDVDRTISGTALESATKVVLTLQTGKTVEIEANNGKDPANLQPGEGALKNGVWTYKLPDNTYLRQTDQSTEIGSSTLPVKVKQTVFTAESDESTIYVAKERNFAGKTITAAQGSQTLTDLKADARKGIKYTEKDVEKAFPGDFTATWKEQPDVETVGTRTYKVQLTETSATGTNKVGEYDVTITVTNPAPAELTHENKQNGTTRIKLPDDADKVAFTIPGDNQLNTVTVTHSERDGWTVPANSVFTKDGDYLVVNSKDVGGNRNITAVATKGDGNLKSTETPTSIPVPEHTVTTSTITKVVGENPTNAELLAAVDVAHKESAALKEGTKYPTTVGSHNLDVVITYADQSTEKVTVPYVQMH